MTPQLETARLLLRPVELSDAEQTQRLFPQWEVVRYLANRVPWPYPADGALTYLRDMALPAMEGGDEWHWTLRLKSAPDQMIGFISLMRTPGHNRGFWLGPQWHGQGLMTEACNAVTDYWFDVLGESLLRVPEAAANLASGGFRRGRACGWYLRMRVNMCAAGYLPKFGKLPPKSGRRKRNDRLRQGKYGAQAELRPALEFLHLQILVAPAVLPPLLIGGILASSSRALEASSSAPTGSSAARRAALRLT